MTAPWAASGASLLPGLSPRPQHHIINKSGESETVVSTHMATFVYIKGCKDMEIVVQGKIGKLCIDDCSGIKISLDNRVVGETVELIKCTGLEMTLLAPDSEVSVFQIDDSADINLHITRKNQLTSLYYIRTGNIKLFQGAGDEVYEFPLTHETDVPDVQMVSHWTSTKPDATMVTERVNREGVFPATEQLNLSKAGQKKPVEDAER